jgi:small subunit ribosomal protein S2
LGGIIERGTALPTELIKKFLEAGVHFGHKTSRWNPKMKKFIFGERSNIYIIDLEKTAECLERARDFLSDITAKGEFVLFVGTKKQVQDVVKQEALRSGMHYVSERWPGGLLTNLATVKKSINRLKDIEKMHTDGTFEKLTKKEIAHLETELAKLNKNFAGIVSMERLPKALYVVDTKKEETAVKEANRLGIPVIGFIDTNCNPDQIAYPIPGNDDAAKSVQLITSIVADTIIDGRKKFLSYLSESGAAIRKEKGAPDGTAPEILPQEEVEIKEIEEIVEGQEAPAGEETPGRKGRVKTAADEKLKARRKV